LLLFTQEKPIDFWLTSSYHWLEVQMKIKIVLLLFLAIFIGFFIKGYSDTFNDYRENPAKLIESRCIKEDKNNCEEFDVEWDKFGRSSREICKCLETQLIEKNIYFESIKEGLYSLGLPIFFSILVLILYLGRNL